jgi:hypothetical protein
MDIQKSVSSPTSSEAAAKSAASVMKPTLVNGSGRGALYDNPSGEPDVER